jgi:hypothetical protein
MSVTFYAKVFNEVGFLHWVFDDTFFTADVNG